MTEEERDEMMRSNWKAQMAAFGYGPDGLALPQKETSGWISVKNRMPEKEGQYLCWFGENTVCKGAAIATYLKEWKAFGSLESRKIYPNITHWMPLPEPPKEVTNADKG